MRAFTLYSAVLIGIYAAVATAVIGYGLSTPEYVGDLTRLGGYREDQFGWTAPQQRFAPPLFTPDRLDADADLLVLGDSMTVHRPGEQTDPGSYWPNWLAAETGWKIAALHRREHTVEEVLAMPAYQAHRPKLFVLEFAERTITGLERLTEAAAQRHGCAAVAASPTSTAPILDLAAAAKPPPQAQAFARPQPAQPWLDLSIGGHRLKHELLRHLAPSTIDTLSFHLTRSDLFSSARPGTLLVFRDDLDKIGFTEARVQQLDCGLRGLQQEVEADGHTRFVVMIVPDKLSTYRPYIEQFPAHYPDVIPQFAQDATLVLPRIDLAFATALAAGTPDLFLPNDTHIGTAGHRLVAETLLAELRRRGLVGG